MLNKKGGTYVFACVLVLFSAIMITLLMTFLGATTQIKHQNEETEKVLDSFVISSAIDIYDSIKMGTDSNSTLDASAFSSRLATFCQLDLKQNMLYSHNDDGTVKFYLSQPILTAAPGSHGGSSLKVTVHYTMHVPLYFCGKQVAVAAIPIYINSYYTPKF